MADETLLTLGQHHAVLGLTEARVLEHDDMLTGRELDGLRAGEAIEKPVYDYANHRRLPSTERVEPADIILLEGILVLDNAALRERMDIRIYIDADADERFIRRLWRDIHDRGRTVESVVEQYRATVKLMHLEFVEPSKRYADIIIPVGAHNQVGLDLVVTKVRAILAERESAGA